MTLNVRPAINLIHVESSLLCSGDYQCLIMIVHSDQLGAALSQRPSFEMSMKQQLISSVTYGVVQSATAELRTCLRFYCLEMFCIAAGFDYFLKHQLQWLHQRKVSLYYVDGYFIMNGREDQPLRDSLIRHESGLFLKAKVPPLSRFIVSSFLSLIILPGIRS